MNIQPFNQSSLNDEAVLWVLISMVDLIMCSYCAFLSRFLVNL